jgi:transcription initiation factor TFIIIB Brf1 subunit/transcription initiation factor TFIIB
LEDEGECVCTGCGLVLERLYKQSDVATAGKLNDEHAKIISFLKDICSNACMPEAVTIWTMNYYYQLLKEKALKNFKKIELASYALYEILSRNKIPRTAKEIEYFTGTQIQILWKIENCLHFSETLNNPQDFVDRYCSLLNIPFYNIRIIKGIVGNMYGMGDIRPNCVVAAVIYLYYKEINEKMSMQTVCEVCCVSTGNMYKIIRNLRKDFVEKISLFYS